VRLPDFTLERWFARFEFSVRFNLCASDVEGMPVAELLALAEPDGRALWDGLTLGYTESAGLPALREEIAGLYAGVTADDVLVCAGAEEAIFLLANALAGPGDRAVCVRPSYQSLHEVARAAGADVVPLDLDPARGWAPDLDALAAALAAGARTVLVNWPHNPTGATVSREVLAEVVGLTDAAGATLVCDEVYRLLEHDPADRLPAGVEASERAVSIGVMSKAFGLAGLRIGWVATRDRTLLARVTALKDYTSICSSAPSEILALIALRAREAVLGRSRAIVAENLPVLREFMDAHSEWLDGVPPAAGTVAFPRLRDGRPADRFAEDLVAAEGVLVLPGAVFGGDVPDRFRVGFGRRDMPEGLERLGRFLRSSAA
jgi:aspartate/methionine/tyrosine aminotransferase